MEFESSGFLADLARCSPCLAIGEVRDPKSVRSCAGEFPQSKRATRASALLFTACSAIVALCFCSSVRAADVGVGWRTWWLPPNHSAHGAAIDTLFDWIFWITAITFVLVEAALVFFLVKYRYRPGTKRISRMATRGWNSSGRLSPQRSSRCWRSSASLCGTTTVTPPP